MIYLATDAFQAYTQLIGAEPDYRSGLISFPATQEALDKVPDLSFNFPGINETVVLNKCRHAGVALASIKLNRIFSDAQLVPKDLYSVFSLDESNYYGWITDMGSQSGSGLDFILVSCFVFIPSFRTDFIGMQGQKVSGIASISLALSIDMLLVP